MGKALRGVVALLGLVVMGAAVFNVQAGLYDLEGESYKLIWAELAQGNCGVDSITEDLNTEGDSDCVGTVELYEMQDLIPIGIGLILFLFSLKSGKKRVRSQTSSASKKVAKKMRGAKIRFGIGISLIATIIADTQGALSKDGEQLDFAELTGLPLPTLVIYTLLGAIAARFVLGSISKLGKMRQMQQKLQTEGDFTDASSMMAQERLFRSKQMEDPFGGKYDVKGIDNFRTVGEMRRSMDLDKYEDEFEKNLSDDDGMSAGRVCHLCSGQGCPTCGMTGSAD